MVTVSCPHCGNNKDIIKFGTNRSGTTRCRCHGCGKTFTLNPKTRALTPDKEQQICRALAERTSQRGIVEARFPQQGITSVPAPEDDAIEIDERCIRVSASPWLWSAVSGKLRRVVGFVIGNVTLA